MFNKGNVFYGDILAGMISQTDDGYEFIYDENYLKKPGCRPISLTIPLKEAPFKSKILFSFFDGLIPEGWLLDLAVNHWNVKYNDRFQLLLLACNDAIGAVSVISVNEEVL